MQRGAKILQSSLLHFAQASSHLYHLLSGNLYFQLYRGGGGGAKSEYPYVGLNSSVTDCRIEIRGNCQLEKYSCSFFSNEGLFSHLFDSLENQIEPNFIGLCLAIRITFVLKK